MVFLVPFSGPEVNRDAKPRVDCVLTHALPQCSAGTYNDQRVCVSSVSCSKHVCQKNELSGKCQMADQLGLVWILLLDDIVGFGVSKKLADRC
jgi:hypothetical protein